MRRGILFTALILFLSISISSQGSATPGEDSALTDYLASIEPGLTLLHEEAVLPFHGGRLDMDAGTVGQAPVFAVALEDLDETLKMIGASVFRDPLSLDEFRSHLEYRDRGDAVIVGFRRNEMRVFAISAPKVTDAVYFLLDAVLVENPVMTAIYMGRPDLLGRVLESGWSPDVRAVRYHDGLNALRKRYPIADFFKPEVDRTELRAAARRFAEQLPTDGVRVSGVEEQGLFGVSMFMIEYGRAFNWGFDHDEFMDDLAREGRDLTSPMGMCVDRNEAACAEVLVEHDVDVNLVTVEGKRTPLLKAIAAGRSEMARVLIRAGADVRIAGDAATSPLHLAAARNDTGTVKVLIEHGAELDRVDTMGRSSLWSAVESGSYEASEILLEAGANPEQASDNGIMPLALSCSRGDVRTLRLLLDFGVNINEPGASGRTPIQAAAHGGHAALVEELLTWNPDIDARNKAGTTAMWLAIQQGHVAIADILLESGADPTLTFGQGRSYAFILSKLRDPGLLSRFVDAGVSVDRADENGNTPLMAAAMTARYDAIDILIDAGAGIDLQNDRGETALFQAAKNNKLEAVQLLLQRQADPTIPDRDGVTPFQIARDRDHYETASILGTLSDTFLMFGFSLNLAKADMPMTSQRLGGGLFVGVKRKLSQRVSILVDGSWGVVASGGDVFGAATYDDQVGYYLPDAYLEYTALSTNPRICYELSSYSSVVPYVTAGLEYFKVLDVGLKVDSSYQDDIDITSESPSSLLAATFGFGLDIKRGGSSSMILELTKVMIRDDVMPGFEGGLNAWRLSFGFGR